MSSDAFVKFYVNGKEGHHEIHFNQYKNLIENNISDYAIPEIVSDAGVSYEQEYLGSLLLGTHIPEEDIENFTHPTESDPEMKIYLTKEATEKWVDKFVDVPTEELLSGEYKTKYFTVYGYKKYEYRGLWFNMKSFETAENKYREEYREVLKELFHLEEIRNSIAYYTLTAEQKEDVLYDIDRFKDDALDLEYRIRACTSLQDVADSISEENEYSPVTMFIYVVR